MKNLLQVIAGTAVFVLVYGLVDWLAGVTAPVLGPIVLATAIIGLITLTVKLAKEGSR